MSEEARPPVIRSAIARTRPVYTHLETEWLFDILLKSGHERAEHLLNRLVEAADRTDVYARTLERARTRVQHEQDNQ